MKKRTSMIILLFIVYVFLSVGGLILFKLGSNGLKLNVNSTGLNMSINWLVICGILFYMCSFVLWLVIVSKMNLSIAMPIQVGVVNILVLIAAAVILKESISIMQWIGTAVVIVGLFLVNWKG